MFPKGHNNILKCWPRDIYFTVIEKKKPENIEKESCQKAAKKPFDPSNTTHLYVTVQIFVEAEWWQGQHHIL